MWINCLTGHNAIWQALIKLDKFFEKKPIPMASKNVQKLKHLLDRVQNSVCIVKDGRILSPLPYMCCFNCLMTQLSSRGLSVLCLALFTALYRSFPKRCTLTNKAVGTIWKAFSKPPQRRHGPDPRPLWLLVGDSFSLWTWARVQTARSTANFKPRLWKTGVRLFASPVRPPVN